MAAFGYPDRSQAQLTFSQEHFQHCFAPEGFTIQNIVNDLAIILQLEPSKITFDFHEDIRDTFGIPYELKDQETDIQSQQIGDTFKIHIAKNIQKSHQTKS